MQLNFFLVSGEPPSDPVVSRKTGFLYERRLILKFIADSGKEPNTDHELSEEDLITLHALPKIVKPRPPTINSIPSLLLLLQNEYDSSALETYTLKKQLLQLRQELSNALYENDAAKRVIARLVRERDAARENLAAVSAAVGVVPQQQQQQENQPQEPGAEDMDVDGEKAGDNDEGEDDDAIAGVNKEIAAKLDAANAQLTKTRKKRKPPAGTATLEEIGAFSAKTEIPSLHSTTNPGVATLDVLSTPPPQQQETSESDTENWVVTGGNDGTIIITNKSSGAQIASVKAHGAKKVTKVAWIENSRGSAFISSSVDHTVKLWNVKEDGAGDDRKWSLGKASNVIKGHTAEVSDVAVHPSCGEYAVSASLDSTWAFLDLERGVQVSKTSHPDGKEAYTSVAIHPDGLIAATGTTDSVVRMWDLKSTKDVGTFKDQQHAGRITSMSFSENGYLFATASADSSIVKLWDLRKLENIYSIDAASASSKKKTGVYKVAFDYGAGYLGVACGDTVSVFKNKTWDEIVKFTPFGEGGSSVSDFKFGAYSKWIATAGVGERKVVVYGV
ncbi:hypothetical protein HK100_000446 [Physocladia obscura]|uniref:Pre-mRNA-processing factor 19 n=1 Tax=Physocladia obscura TaxID=109957 RepID=A0AAD5XHJ8_9FUNG|nr:hypothetical protein HK100_000446 [Physocladia obscura]